MNHTHAEPCPYHDASRADGDACDGCADDDLAALTLFRKYIAAVEQGRGVVDAGDALRRFATEIARRRSKHKQRRRP